MWLRVGILVCRGHSMYVVMWVTFTPQVTRKAEVVIFLSCRRRNNMNDRVRSENGGVDDELRNAPLMSSTEGLPRRANETISYTRDLSVLSSLIFKRSSRSESTTITNAMRTFVACMQTPLFGTKCFAQIITQIQICQR